MPSLNRERTDLLDRHAELLRQRDGQRAAALAAESEPALAALMRCAERVQGQLLWSAPDPEFRHRLGEMLRQEARRAWAVQAPDGSRGRALAQNGVSALRRHRRRILAGGGAAVAVIGVTLAVLLRDRSGAAETAGS